MVSMEVIRISR